MALVACGEGTEMIGQNSIQIRNDDTPWRTVLRDAVVYAAISALSKLATKTYQYVCEHAGEVVSEITVTWLLMFFTSLAITWGIRRQR